MKVKLKLDQKAILEFLLQNGEKIVLGVVAVIFLVILYKGIATARPFGKSPDQLEEKVRQGQQQIEATPPNTGLAVADYTTLAKKSVGAVEEKPYGNAVLWNSPLFERKPLRDAPPLFPAEQFRGTAGLGAFQVTAGAAKQGRGRRWIVLTGLVPAGKQESEYNETLKHSAAYNPQTDHPIYNGYVVQRVEVASPAEAAKPDWSKAKEFSSAQAIAAARAQWAADKGGDATNDPLVFPLGPLARPWDASVAHDPEIPFAKGAPPAAAATPGSAKPTVEQTTVGGYKLLRFFDFDVEPGKQYVYRVCLVLQNPNQGIKPALLKSAKLAESPTLTTSWSEASPTISVPNDTRVLVASVSTPARADPSGKIIVVTWLPQQGLEVPREFPVVRGQVANFPKQTVKVAAAERPKATGRGGPAIGASGGTSVAVDFLTNATIVDFRGGEPLPGRSGLNAVGEILVLNPDGTLAVRNELDDALTYERLSTTPADSTAESAPASGSARSSGRGLDGFSSETPRKKPAHH
jgi:hypothetical protein